MTPSCPPPPSGHGRPSASRGRRPVDPATFDAIVDARAIAIIGASSNPESLSGRPLGYLRHYGYDGRVYPINPAREEVQGQKAYPSIGEVPERVDLAMVAVRAELVPRALRECIEAGVKVAVVVSSGFGEGGGRGADVRDEALEILAGGDLRVVGPNCEGILSMPNRMPLTFSPVADVEKTGRRLIAGDIAVVSHSGGLAFAVAQWGAEVGLGFNYVFSTGNEIDLDALGVAEAVIERDDTHVLVLLVESLDGDDSAERVVRLGARARDAGKHVVAAKLGRSAPGRGAAYRHTLHDAGDQAAYDALFAEAGIHSVLDEDDLLDAIHVLSKVRGGPPPARAQPETGGRRVAILSTSGGAGAWLADACDAVGLEVPLLSEPVQTAIAPHMPGYGTPANPVDLTAQFFAGGSFAPVLDVLCASGEVDAVVIATSLAAAGRLESQRDGLAAIRSTYGLPIVMFSYTTPAPANAAILQELDIPYFPTTRRAANALARLLAAGGP